jgi:glycosyltransferase involved in cell wall biosynthesis
MEKAVMFERKFYLPTISIITPSFNQAEFLEECIDSILSQNYPNLEYIIMDGGSTDGSVDIIKKYEKYLSYWQSQPDGGQYNAINDGFKRTSGEIMAWLNSDDKYHRDALFKVAHLFNSNSCVEWITGHPTFWGKSGEFTHMEPVMPTYCGKYFLEGKYNQPFIQQESTFWKRSLWERAGGRLRTDLDYAGDLELWLRFFRYALLFSVDTFFGGYRSHGNQKAALFMDRYVAEAEMVLSAERLLYENYSHPESPSPLFFDVAEYHEFLKSVPGCHPAMFTAAEGALQKLLRETASLRMLSLQEEKNSKAIDLEVRLAAIQSSRSWRITKPLRWLGDLVRKR